MLKKINSTVFLIVILFSLVYGQEIENIGYLSVESNENIEIYLNSVLISNTPFTNLALTPGIYTIESYFINDLNWLNRGIKKEIEIIAGEYKTCNLSPEKLIKINTVPFNCDIIFENSIIGKTPIILKGEQYRNRTFTLRKNDYDENSFSIDSNKDEYFFELKSKNKSPESPVLKSELEKNNFNWNREGLIAVTLVCSWASFYFKREADDYYFQYLHTANPNLMNEFYDSSVRYDTYSHIAIGTSIVSLGAYLYLLLSE